MVHIKSRQTLLCCALDGVVCCAVFTVYLHYRSQTVQSVALFNTINICIVPKLLVDDRSKETLHSLLIRRGIMESFSSEVL